MHGHKRGAQLPAPATAMGHPAGSQLQGQAPAAQHVARVDQATVTWQVGPHHAAVQQHRHLYEGKGGARDRGGGIPRRGPLCEGQGGGERCGGANYITAHHVRGGARLTI